MSERTPTPEPPTSALPSASTPVPRQLSERDEAVLAFERQWWRHVGAKEEAIRATFGLSAARYYQVLGALVDSPLALAFDPMLVKRLQRMRSVRSEARASRSLPTHD
ncbi:MAG: DUF3263 domain-containing protein [Cryobacterium sp.]|uniref:DUF3263 domain-containing protein n=1 Tax=unclassified Cryobacterium TaxID=2649013 RepID=UPI0018CAFD5F|nr:MULTISPECIES: DUF3263 domain-containing protein [unclassified Cryobacterium]MCY7404289.1 DUF3263 domain-containing protein [Cryobacterium sp.]MEC5155024.1 hypothetical protein [Cryobacterium sp. CAN_C3]